MIKWHYVDGYCDMDLIDAVFLCLFTVVFTVYTADIS